MKDKIHNEIIGMFIGYGANPYNYSISLTKSRDKNAERKENTQKQQEKNTCATKTTKN